MNNKPMDSRIQGNLIYTNINSDELGNPTISVGNRKLPKSPNNYNLAGSYVCMIDNQGNKDYMFVKSHKIDKIYDDVNDTETKIIKLYGSLIHIIDWYGTGNPPTIQYLRDYGISFDETNKDKLELLKVIDKEEFDDIFKKAYMDMKANFETL
jgi:hypothetical protein